MFIFYNLHLVYTFSISAMGLVLTLVFLMLVLFIPGCILVIMSDEKGRRTGFRMIIFAFLLLCFALLLYGYYREELWDGIEDHYAPLNNPIR